MTRTGIAIQGPKKAAVREARESILAILDAVGVDNKTKRTALLAFQHLTEIKNVTVQNCTISMASERQLESADTGE